ncbi:MAG: sulfur oxidation c-type cytochrome SoxX [Burkholderiaceae bacterium]
MAALLTLVLSAGACGLAAQGISPTPSEPGSDTTPALSERLSDRPGDPKRGRAIVASRQEGLCLLCHSGPFEPKAHQGTLAGTLQGAGLRWNEAQLRQRLVNPRRINPDSLMPAFHDTADQQQVARVHAGKPILSAQQIEDVVAYLLTLQEAP